VSYCKLLRLRRYSRPLYFETPVEAVVPVPGVLPAVRQLQSPLHEFDKDLEFVAMVPDDFGG
jgi:hypothetical protein